MLLGLHKKMSCPSKDNFSNFQQAEQIIGVKLKLNIFIRCIRSQYIKLCHI